MHEQVEKSTFSIAYPNFLDWRNGNRAFESMAAYNRHDGLSLTGIGDRVGGRSRASRAGHAR